MKILVGTTKESCECGNKRKLNIIDGEIVISCKTCDSYMKGILPENLDEDQFDIIIKDWKNKLK